MRIKQVLAFIGAATLSTLALAEPAPVSVSPDGNTVTVRGDTSPVFRLSPGQAEDVTGSFRLQDGRTMRLTSRSNKVFMEVDGKREQMLPLSRTEFVASDSGARLALDRDTFPDQVHLVQFRR